MAHSVKKKPCDGFFNKNFTGYKACNQCVIEAVKAKKDSSWDSKKWTSTQLKNHMTTLRENIGQCTNDPLPLYQMVENYMENYIKRGQNTEHGTHSHNNTFKNTNRRQL